MASLHVAVLFGDEQLTRSLIEKGSDVNAYDKRLGTPLSIAVLKGYRSLVKLLHERGANPNSEQFATALIHSSLDEMELPSIGPGLDQNSRSASRSAKVLDSSSTFKRDGKNAENDSFRQESTEDTTSDSEIERSWPKGVIQTLYKRDGKLKETPDDSGMKSTLLRFKDDQQGCSIVKIMEHNDESEWFVCEIRIRGHKLCGFIAKVLEGYPGIGHERSKLTLYPALNAIDFDFIALFHRSENYIRLCEEEIDSDTKEQAELLLQCLKPLWKPINDLLDHSKASGLIRHGHLGFLYEPEQVVLVRHSTGNIDKSSAAKLKEVVLSFDHTKRVFDWELTAEVVNWNGFSSGFERRKFVIEHYHGFKRIDAEICPISYASDPDAVRTTLIKRGRKFESLRGCFFLTRNEFNIQRRVIIDNYAYHRFHVGHGCVPQYGGLDDRPRRGFSDHTFDPDEMLPSAFATGSCYSGSTSGERDKSPRPLTDDECFLCVPTMHGYDVQEKKWNVVEVEGLESVIWNDQAFTHLTMPEDQKRLILAFTRQKQVEETKFDDFIAGKGKSLIILLCGPPGVGKTLTAESDITVAERSRAPLYTLSAGDLGTNAASVERALKNALDLCSHWKAVMLIDEADVFLEARKTDNLKRNELVSVFLRLLEYYNGILFLTTNRAATIDPAFESRIDIIIPYEDLNVTARRQIWANFVKTLVAATHELRDTDFDELSRRKLNGREIKSTVKTALMLATGEGQILQMQHLNIVLDIRQRAVDYLHGEVSADGRR